MEETYFIAFEGIDGCGKDTQLHKLVEAVKEDNNGCFGDKYSNIWVTREPTKITKNGVKISNLIREEDVSGEEATKYFVKDRIEHSILIKQFLQHSHVFTSRYDLSTFSYQMTQGMDFRKMYAMHNYRTKKGAIIPNLTIVFDLPTKVAFERLSKRNSKKEFFEKKEFQEKLQKNLKFCIKELQKIDGRKIIIVNANQSIEDVTKEMVEKISEVIN